jgi:hypothetical protein
MKIKNIIIATLALVLVSCASSTRDSQKELKKLIVANDYKKAVDFVSNEKFLSDKNSELLRTLERARVFYLNKDYFQSLNEFNKARDISDQLFTVSISKKASSALFNDNADNYYGENYEKSLIRYYQAMSHMMLAAVAKYETYTIVETSADGKTKTPKVIAEKKLSPQEIKFHSTAAKNVLLDWDSYLTSVKSVTGGEVTFKDDLMAKLFGAFIHDNAGSASDRQIAKDLYKEARNVLLKNYNIYRVYNSKFADFRKDFSKYAEMPINEVEKNYVLKTNHYSDLLTYIDQRIADMDKGVRNNTLIVLEEGFVQEKTAKVFDIPLAKAAGTTSTNSVPMAGDFISFAMKVLDTAADALPKIYFELPEVPMPLIAPVSKLIVESVDGKIKKELQLQLVDPVSEIANQALDEKTTALYLKTGVRVAGKHLAALLGAYAIYNNQKGKGEFIALTMATVSYKAANKGIEVSERADLRSWQTLPQNYRLVSTSLPAGDYVVKLATNGNLKELSKITIADTDTNIINLQN